jgi:uncharacterized membrane protein
LNRTSQKSWHLIGAILILYLALVFIKLGTTSLWLDEIMSMDFCDGNLPELFRSLREDVHTPLFYILLMVFIKIGGIAEIVGRLPGVLAGAGCLLALYDLGKEIKDRRFALLSCLILAVSPFFLEFCREIHPYSQSALLSILSWSYFLRIMKRGKKIHAIGYAISSGLLILTFYLSVLVLFTQFLLFLFLRISNRKKKLIFLGWIGAAVIFSIWLPVFARQLMMNKISPVVNVLFPKGIKMDHIALLLSHIFLGAWGQRPGLFSQSMALFCFLLGISLSLFQRRGSRLARTRRKIEILPFWMFWGLFLLFTLLCLLKPLYISRYMTMSAPFAALFLGLAVASIRGWGKYAFLSLFILWSLLSYRAYLVTLPREDWRGSAQYLIAHAQPNDVIVLDHISNVSCLVYYFKILKNPELNDNVFTYEHFDNLTGGAYPFANRTLWYLTKRMEKNERLSRLRNKNIPLSHISFLGDFELYSFKGKGVE